VLKAEFQSFQRAKLFKICSKIPDFQHFKNRENPSREGEAPQWQLQL
jgi:hypothetical protein